MAETEIEHVGRFAGRCNDGSFSGNLEKAFADSWRETNNPPGFLNGGVGTLQWLLHAEHRSSKPGDVLFGHGVEWSGDVTQEEATVAATVIQWLGTSCGRAWLEETLKKGGYSLVWKGEPRG